MDCVQLSSLALFSGPESSVVSDAESSGSETGNVLDQLYFLKDPDYSPCSALLWMRVSCGAS